MAAEAILLSEQVFFLIPFLRRGPLDPIGTLWKASAVFGATGKEQPGVSPGGVGFGQQNETHTHKKKHMYFFW